jgi:hypothetical protein
MTRLLSLLLFHLLLGSSLMTTANDQAVLSAERTITVSLQTPVETAFSLFGPVEEQKWETDWHPSFLYQAGPAEHPTFAVMTTGEGDAQTTWVLSSYDLPRNYIQYVTMRPGHLLTVISIRCVAADHGNSRCEITYRRTALRPENNTAVEHFAQSFTSQGRHWEQVLNEYLRHAGKSTPTSGSQKPKGM